MIPISSWGFRTVTAVARGHHHCPISCWKLWVRRRQPIAFTGCIVRPRLHCCLWRQTLATAQEARSDAKRCERCEAVVLAGFVWTWRFFEMDLTSAFGMAFWEIHSGSGQRMALGPQVLRSSGLLPAADKATRCTMVRSGGGPQQQVCPAERAFNRTRVGVTLYARLGTSS